MGRSPDLAALDLNLLVALDALLQTGSVTGAAGRVGVSQPAMSNALGRLRDVMDDPLLVRAGRRMALTPRAESLRDRVRALCERIGRVVESDEGFEPACARRGFRVASGGVAAAIVAFLPAFVRLLAARAPGVDVEFQPVRDGARDGLAQGGTDLALVLAADVLAGFHTRALVEDRLVCMVRRDHPKLGERLSLDDFLALPHVRVSQPGLSLDPVEPALERHGYARRAAFTVPEYFAVPMAVAASDCLAVVPERFARLVSARMPLRLLSPPLELPVLCVVQLWHERTHADPGCRWLRDLVQEAAAPGGGGRAAGEAGW